MQTVTIRIYDDPGFRRLAAEAPIARAEAIAQIREGFAAATELVLNRDAPGAEDLWMRSRCLQWAGYEPYRAAAPLGQQHLARIQLRPDIGAFRDEYVFPGGLGPAECDDLCLHVVGEDGDDTGDREREWLVTSTLASMLHADGVSLADHVIALARGQTALVDGLAVMPAGPPTTLYAAVRDRGWGATADWLRDTQATLERGLGKKGGSAVWVPTIAPRLPWEPLVLRYRDVPDCLRLALGAEAAAYAGQRVELAVSAAERADWLTDREAALKAGMCPRRWRRWIETHRDVRVGRPIARNGRLAKNRRLIHRGDLRRELGLAQARNKGRATKKDEPLCMGPNCPFRCLTARGCRHRHRDCPAA